MGCIYLLYDDNGRCYVGKTVDIHNRLNLHKSKYNRTRSRYLNKDYKCDVIVECDDEDELAKLEQTYFDYYKDLCGEKCVNYMRPLQTQKEYRETNKERIAEGAKEWRETHKEEMKEYYEKNKEQHNKVSKEYYETHKEELKEKNKEYYETHKEQHNKVSKQYYEKNKEGIAEKANQKITCECGSVVRYGEKSRHAKSIKHQNYLRNLLT